MSPNWTDDDLISLCARESVTDVDPQWIETLRSRWRESAAIQQAVAASPQKEWLLAQLKANDPPPRSRWWLRVLTTVVLIQIALIACLMNFAPEDADEPTEIASGDVQADAPSTATVDQPTIKDAEGASNEPATQPHADSTLAEATPGVSKVTQPVAATPDDAVWAGPLDLQKPPLNWESTVWQPIAADSPDSLPPTVFRKWFGDAASKPLKVAEDKVDKRSFTIVEGPARLLAPWVENAVLRLALFNTERCDIYCWRGNEGVRLSFVKGSQSPLLWTVHRVARENAKDPGTLGEFLGTDSGRWEMSRFGVFELRVEGGQVMLTRGHVPFLRVPFAGLPDEVVLDGKFRVRDLKMYRSDPLPLAELDEYRCPIGRSKFASTHPADLEWKLKDDAALSFERLKADGDDRARSVELKSNAALKEAGWATLELPKAGLCEIVFRVEHADAGAGLCIGSASGATYDKISFLSEPKTKRVVVGVPFPWLQITEFTKEANALPQVYLGPSQWFRMIGSAGTLQVWMSPDGREWSRIGQHQFPNEWRRVEALRLFVMPGAERRIRLSHLDVREFSTITGLADAALCQQVDLAKFEPLLQGDLGSWLHQVLRLRPEGVTLATWRRACAIECLRVGPTPTLAIALLSGLAHDGLFGEQPVAPLDEEAIERGQKRDLQLLAELALLHHVGGYEQGLAFNQLWSAVTEKWIGVAADASVLPRAERYRSIVERGIEALFAQPLWCSIFMKPLPFEGARRELTLLAHAGRNSDILKLIDRLTFFFSEPHPSQFWWGPADALYNPALWAELTALQGLDAETQAQRALQSQRWKPRPPLVRHPLTQPFNKEAYNLMAEFQAALSSNAYGDACQVIGAAATAQFLGFVPDSRDAALLVSFPRAVASAMDDHPELRATMNDKFGAVGRLRVRQAMDASDVAVLEGATVQFYGTLAAAESERWLGNRAFAAGQFAQAHAHYQRAKEGFARHSQVQTQQTQELAARMQLVAAMLGINEPAALPSAVAFGEQTVSQQQLDTLSQEFRSASGTEVSGDVAGQRTVMPTRSYVTRNVPPLRTYRWEPRAKFDGDVGNKIDSGMTIDIDWFARQMAITVSGSQAFLSNRFQVSCLDLESGQIKWNAALKDEHGNTHHWPKMAMTPLVAGRFVFCRRLTSKRPELHAFNKETGELLWRADVKTNIVSDPWLARGRLQVFATDMSAGICELQLLSFDLETGRLVSDVPIVRLLDDVQLSTQACTVTTRDDWLYFAVSGVVGCCDTQGQTIWLRRQLWQPPAVDSLRHQRAFDAPLLVGDALIVSQPGVPVVEALDLSNGRVRWSRAASDQRRLLGLTDGRLIVETSEGLEAWSPTTGEPQWRYRAADLLDAVLLPDPTSTTNVAGASEVRSALIAPQPTKDAAPQTEPLNMLASRTVDRPDGHKAPCLVWIDAKTGREVAFQRFDEYEDRAPRIGPLFIAGNKTWACAQRSRTSGASPILELVPSDDPKVLLNWVVDQSLWAGWFPEFQRDTFPTGAALRPSLKSRVLGFHLREPYAKQAPGWLVLGQLSPPRDSGYRAEVRGRKDVLALQLAPAVTSTTYNATQPEVPLDALRLVKQFKIPSTGTASFEISVGYEAKREWELIIDASSQRLHRSLVNDKTAPEGWRDVKVDLSSLAGQTTEIVVTCAPLLPGGSWIYLSRLP